jgi:hypothetical protein
MLGIWTVQSCLCLLPAENGSDEHPIQVPEQSFVSFLLPQPCCVLVSALSDDEA